MSDRQSAEIAPTLLRLSGLHKRFGAAVVIDDLSIEVKQGEFFALLGPSGCGKTTTLRMLAGFIEPDAGSIFLDGVSIERLPSHRREAAMVFQNYALFPHMTVFDNIAFGLKMQKRPKAEIIERVHEAMRLVRLPSYDLRFPKELSGGQQQRVALARALVLRPKLLLLDEPLSNLDANLRKALRDEVIEIHRITGTTTIFVTHDLEEALVMADRVAVMNKGRVEQCGTPQDIFLRPATAFVADFIGHENVIEGELFQNILKKDALQIRVPINIRSDRVGLARFAVLAANIELSEQPLDRYDNCFIGTINRIRFYGGVTRVMASVGACQFIVQVGSSAVTRQFSEGMQVYLAWASVDMVEIKTDATT